MPASVLTSAHLHLVYHAFTLCKFLKKFKKSLTNFMQLKKLVHTAVVDLQNIHQISAFLQTATTTLLPSETMNRILAAAADDDRCLAEAEIVVGIMKSHAQLRSFRLACWK